jgi:hypothetical protein
VPTAYVKKMADKHGISVGAAEEKWERAKKAAGEKLEPGSKRFWPYVMGIFKRMFGEAEVLTLKDYLLIEEEVQKFPKYFKLVGPYVAERTWYGPDRISYTVKKILSSDRIPLQISTWPGDADDPTGSFWSFVLSDSTRHFGLRPQVSHQLDDLSYEEAYDFKAFSEWAREHMKHLVDEGIVDKVTVVTEAKGDPVTIPKGVATLPKRIMVGVGGYYLELQSVKPTKATFEVKRLLGKAPGVTFTISKRKVLALLASQASRPTSYMLQAHGEPLSNLTWSDRSLLGAADVVKPFDYHSIRQFMGGIIQKAGLDRVSEEVDSSHEGFKRVVIYPASGRWPDSDFGKPDLTSVFNVIRSILKKPTDWYHRYDIDGTELDDQCASGGKVEFWMTSDNSVKPQELKRLGVKVDYLSDYAPTYVLEDKKEDGVKKSYLDFKGSSKKKELKDEMKREIKRFSKLSHKDKAAYPDDWTADQKYKAELKKKGKKLPKSQHTKEFERRYGK